MFFCFFFFFRHGNEVEWRGERDGVVDGKSRARGVLERGESNVRAQKTGNSRSERVEAVVGPVVQGHSADVARVYV